MVKKGVIGIYLFVCLSLTCTAPLFAQSNINEEAGGNGPAPSGTFYKYDVQAGGEITYPLTNADMVKTFVGIYSADAAFDISLLKRLYVGGQVCDNEFAIAANPLFGTLNPRMYNYMGGLRVGYHSSNDKSNDFLFNAMFTAGESHIVFTNAIAVAPKGGFAQNQPFGTLCIVEAYRVNEQCWIGLDISYTLIDYAFDPDYIGIQNQGLTYYPADAKGNTTYIGWGFQIIYDFSKGRN